MSYQLRRIFVNSDTQDVQSFGITEHAKPAEGYNPAGFAIYRVNGPELRWLADIGNYSAGVILVTELNKLLEA